MKFHLTGKIYYSVGSCHDSRSEEINATFGAESKEDGIKAARILIQDLHEKNSHLTDYDLRVTLNVVEPILEVRSVEDKPAQPAVEAKLAQPAVTAHLEEKDLSC